MEGMDELAICMRLVSISPPFDANQTVELKFVLPACQDCLGGDMLLRVSPSHAVRYMIGDEYFIRARRI